MMSETAPAALPIPAPTPGLIASLNARSRLDYNAQGRTYASLLITYAAPQFEDTDPAEVERLMLGVAYGLGAVPAVLPPTAPGRAPSFSVDRVSVARSGETLVHFDGTPWSLRVARSPTWTRVMAGVGQVLLVVGLDQLSPVASAAEVDEYIECVGAADRLYATVSSVADRPSRRPPGAAAPMSERPAAHADTARRAGRHGPQTVGRPI